MTFTPKSDFLQIMLERGFVADCTDYDGLTKRCVKGACPPISDLMQRPVRCMWAA